MVMVSNSNENQEIAQHVETLQCDQCRKRWQVAWVGVDSGNFIDHSVTCDCGRVLKVVRTDADDPPLMILQHSWGKTIAASLPSGGDLRVGGHITADTEL